ncbi:MAG: hypothetical protein HYZ48_01600, partial [Chlamydiales bacterium]|nr:hypothetical protein [Chlamydiales bacterium]
KAERVSFDWAQPEVLWAKKIEGVHAEPAKENEILETKHGDEVMTYNISQKGDWKITTSQGDQYFLSDKKFRDRYFVEDGKDGFYQPRPNPVRMIRTTKPVRLRSPWGAWQYLAPGSVIAKLSEEDVYGIHAVNFNASYRRTDEHGNILAEDLLDPAFVMHEPVFGEAWSIEQRLEKLNPDQDHERIFAVQNWSLDEFDKPHHPVIIGEIDDQKRFDHFEGDQGVRDLDLLIHAPGQGWAMPKNLEPFKEMIEMAAQAEGLASLEPNNRFVHITVDQKIVPQDKPGRRAGLHADSGLWDELGDQQDVRAELVRLMELREGKPTDHAYIAYDALPTGFYPGPFGLSQHKDRAQGLRSFEALLPAEQQPVFYPPYTVLRLNAYDVHSSMLNQTGHPVRRTFVKIQFTERRLERPPNTQNP